MSLLIPTRAITDASADYPQGYHRGNVGGLPAIEPDLVAENIKFGVTVFGIVGTMVQWIYDLSHPELAKLIIPTPSLALAVAEDHSGGGFTAEKTLTIPVPTIDDAAEESWLLVEDCEDAWNEYVQANVTSTADGVTFKYGAASAKLAVADAAAVGRLATEVISKDLSSYRYLKAWVRSSVPLSSGDLSILLDDHPECVSPLKDLDIGDISADTWTEVVLDMGDTSGCTAIISIGIDMKNDKGIFDFWIDQVRATQGL